MYSIFYLPLHVVYKGSSTTTKVQAVFDASANSMSGVSLNDHLLVGPTVHSSLVDDLLRFRFNRIAVTADVSKMYSTIELMQSNRFMLTTDWLELIMSKQQSTSRKKELQGIFSRGRFRLHKWNSSESAVLQHINPELWDVQDVHLMWKNQLKLLVCSRKLILISFI